MNAREVNSNGTPFYPPGSRLTDPYYKGASAAVSMALPVEPEIGFLSIWPGEGTTNNRGTSFKATITDCPLDGIKPPSKELIDVSTLAKNDTTPADPALIAEYLRYAYTANDKALEVEVAKLFILENAPDKEFRNRSLITACEKSILRGVTNKNVLDYYTCGEKIKSDVIQEACFDFMKKNKKDIWKTQEQFEKSCDDLPELMYKLLID